MADLDIFDIAPLIENVSTTIQFMHVHNLLLQDYFCCNKHCSKMYDSSLTDKQIFQCNICHHRYSIRSGSFWSKSKLCLTVLLTMLFFFAQGLTIK